MFKKILRSPVTSVVLFLAAAALLLSASIGGTQAMLQIFSDDYLAEIELDQIAVGLTEANAGHPTKMVSKGIVIYLVSSEFLCLLQSVGEELADYARRCAIAIIFFIYHSHSPLIILIYFVFNRKTG